MTQNPRNAEQVLITGATSGIARAIAGMYAKRGVGRLILAGRDTEALEQDAANLRTRHNAEVEVCKFDASQPETCGVLQNGLEQIDVAVLCHGVMLGNEQAITDPDAHRGMIAVNYTSYTLLAEKLAGIMIGASGGVIAVLSSVAGDRGRGTNYCYGATKAALTAYADGLRGRMHGTGVHVVTVKPGPVRTAMTAGMDGYEKMADPDQVAKQIVKAIDRRKDILYTPGKWRWIMAIIRAIPETIFKRLTI